VQNFFSSVSPIITEEVEGDAMEVILVESSLKKKGEDPAGDENDENVPPPPKKKRQRNPDSVDSNGIREAIDAFDPRPMRNLRSRGGKPNYKEKHTINDYLDDHYKQKDIPVTTQKPKSKPKNESKAPLEVDRFPEFANETVLMEYDGVSLKMEDYKCLDRQALLSGDILDFYLKYIFLELLTDEQRNRVHIFPTTFYFMYATQANYKGWQEEKEKDLKAVDIRYNRVKNIIPDVDLFSKDFIVFPCLDNGHWFLTIVCFPSLNGAFTYDGAQVASADAGHDPKNANQVPLKRSCVLVFDSVKSNPSRKTTAMRHVKNFINSLYHDRYSTEYAFVMDELASNAVKVS
jgi:Ulp1 family protease